MNAFNGLGMNMGNLSRLSNAKTRSVSPENFSGEKGGGGMSIDGPAKHAASDLGLGWKVSPYVVISPGETFTMADIEGMGAVQHIWLTITGVKRFSILRMYWDDCATPSVECPISDFFAAGWGGFSQVNSLPICVNPGSAYNCYWEMPFKKRCRITVENIDNSEITLYYQITYALADVPDDAGYFHAQFRRVNPLPYKEVYTILDGIKGKGHYVGTHMLWGVNNTGWWGEGEIKFYMDGDNEFPTICGTGTEDYFCGSYNFDTRAAGLQDGGYTEFCTPYAGLSQIVRPDGLYSSQTRFSMYRWHVCDPIRFEEDLKVTIQALGWRSGGRYLPLQDDIASVAYWYQDSPSCSLAVLPDKDSLEIV